MIDAEKALDNLRRGMDQIAGLWRESGRSHQRVDQILGVASRLTWGISVDGQRWSHRSGPVEGSEVRVVVLERDPAPQTALVPGQAFQTFPEMWGDEVPTVYVSRMSYTTLWAGLVLCHELDHALEYRDGVSTPGESESDWDAAEGRVHRNEAVLLDAITGGRFMESVGGQDLEDLLNREPVGLASELMTTVPARLRQPHRSESEMYHRRGALIMSAVIVAALGSSDSVFGSSTTDVDLGQVYRRAYKAWK